MYIQVILTNDAIECLNENRLKFTDQFGPNFTEIYEPENYISSYKIDSRVLVVLLNNNKSEDAGLSSKVDPVKFITMSGPQVQSIVFIIEETQDVLDLYKCVDQISVPYSLKGLESSVRVPNWSIHEIITETKESIEEEPISGDRTFLGCEVQPFITDEDLEVLDSVYWVIHFALQERRFAPRDLSFAFTSEYDSSSSKNLATFVVEEDLVVKVQPNYKIIYVYQDYKTKERNVVTGLTVDQLAKIIE